MNVPPYLNAETTVLQDINDTGYFQASAQALNAAASPSMLPVHSCPDLLRRSMRAALCGWHLSRSECSLPAGSVQPPKG